MHERAPLLGLDLAHAVEGLVDVVHELHLGAQLPAARHAVGVGGLRHHHLGRGPEHAGRVGHGHRVVAGADRSHPASPGFRGHAQHHGERAPRLEGARALEQLLLQEDLGARAHRPVESVVLPAPNRGGDHEVAQPRARGADGLEGGRLGQGQAAGPSPSSASLWTSCGPSSVHTANCLGLPCHVL